MKFLVLCIFFIKSSFAFVFTKTEFVVETKWRDKDQLNIYVNPTPLNQPYINDSQFKSIFQNSISQWQGHLPFIVNYNYQTSEFPIMRDASVSFSDDSRYFGAGVLAVTRLNYDSQTGEILRGDILINSTVGQTSKFITNAQSSSNYFPYLGDILTHELGHLWGLGHSNVTGASMTYSVFRGQFEPQSDDLEGVYSLYNLDSETYSISGKVVGGQGVPVFGSGVQLLKASSLEVVAGQLTDTNGEFEFTNLEENEKYIIYNLPPRNVSALPSFYSTIDSLYCDGGEYVASFFTRCGGRSYGKPAIIDFTQSEKVNVGNITIRCSNRIAPQYLLAKTKGEDFAIRNAESEIFIGYFFESDLLSQKRDRYILDATEHQNTVEKYLNIKLTSGRLGVDLAFDSVVYDSNNNPISTSLFQFDSLGKPVYTQEHRVSLSANSDDNFFYLEVIPKQDTFLSVAQKNSYFSNTTTQINRDKVYLLRTLIEEQLASGYKVSYLKTDLDSSDNSSCSEGSVSYTTYAKTSNPQSLQSFGSNNISDGVNIDKSEAPVNSCSFVKNDSGSNSFILSFIFGIMFTFLFIRRDISLS